MSGIRAMQLVNFKGDRYLTEPEVDQKISDIGIIGLKPFVFNASAMEVVDVKNRKILIPGVVLNVFNNETGVVYGDIEYVVSGENSGKTWVLFEDYAATGFGNESTFTAMAFVLSDGSPIPVLSAEVIE